MVPRPDRTVNVQGRGMTLSLYGLTSLRFTSRTAGRYSGRGPTTLAVGGVEMRKALLLASVLLLLSGCYPVSTRANEPPEARITSISPKVVPEGQSVTFVGGGTDSDGEVVGYLWRSSLDGELSRMSTFQTTTLSKGEHVVYLKVQDNNDAWSAEVKESVTVVAAVPVSVTSFTATPATVERGKSTTLSWTVANATSVSIDQGIGAVPPSGSVQVTPEVTTTYTLTALGAGPAATAGLTVTVSQALRRITLTADTDMSGYVRWSGIYRTVGIYVGDDQSNRGIQGFLTYRISRIPEGAVIERVIVDMSDYDLPYDSPFPHMGCLGAYLQSYTTLYGAYWMGDDVSSPMAVWCDLPSLNTPAEQLGFKRALQRRVGENVFQFRLQFAERESDYDDVRDMLHWQRDFMPRLIVEYYVE